MSRVIHAELNLSHTVDGSRLNNLRSRRVMSLGTSYEASNSSLRIQAFINSGKIYLSNQIEYQISQVSTCKIRNSRDIAGQTQAWGLFALVLKFLKSY